MIRSRFALLNRRRTIIMSGMGIALTAALLAGCSTAPDSGNSDSGGKTLTYWSLWKEGEPQQKVLAATIADFTKSTGIKVKVEWQGRDVLKKLAPTLATGEVPDLIDQEAAPIQTALVSLDEARDLSDAYKEAIPGEKGATIGSVIPARYKPLMSSGKTLYMVPYEIVSSAFWYNGAALPELASSPPTTWKQFTELVKQRSAVHPPLALDGDIPVYNSYYTSWALIRELGAGGFNSLVADKKGQSWDDPRVLDAAQKISDLVKAGYFIDGYDASKWPANQQKWATGAADFLLLGSWAPGETSSYQSDGFEATSFQFPNVGGKGDDSVETGLAGFAVPKQAKNYGAAKKFMAFVLRKDTMSAISTDALVLSPRTDVPAPKALLSLQASLTSAKSIHRPYDGVDADFPNYTATVYGPINDQLMFGKITPAQWVSQLKTATINYWKQNG